MTGVHIATDFLLTARISLGVFFLPAAVAKFRDLSGFAKGLDDYAILPDGAIIPVALALPIAEGALGAALLIGIALPLSGILAVIMLASFTAAIGINLRRGRQIGCNCYGIAGTRRIGVAIIARNAALLSLSVTVVVLGAVIAGSDYWRYPSDSGWSAVTSASDALVVAIPTSCCIVLVYLLEWGLDMRSQFRSTVKILSEGS
jgi:uncharacterized membrane protein YphA (DoxX/SURF4 family)